MKTFNSEQVISALKEACKAEGSQKAWANKHGLSSSFVTDVLQGRRGLTDRVLTALGLRKEEIYKSVRK